jgi:hypothetical protein
MLDKDADGAANRFMTKLTGNSFTMARSLNKENNYDEGKQERDSKAVEEFVQTEVFQDIKGLR